MTQAVCRFSVDSDETPADENLLVTLDDVLTVKIDFNPLIANSMWFA
jgi:hypothetical protein